MGLAQLMLQDYVFSSFLTLCFAKRRHSNDCVMQWCHLYTRNGEKNDEISHIIIALIT